MNTIHAKFPAFGMPVLEGPVNKPEVADVRLMMLEMMNKERAEKGLPPQSLDDFGAPPAKEPPRPQPPVAPQSIQPLSLAPTSSPALPAPVSPAADLPRLLPSPEWTP